MKEIIIKTQKELDVLKEDFKEFTLLKIICDNQILNITRTFQNAILVLVGSQNTIKSWDSSQNTIKSLDSSQNTIESLGSSQNTIKSWDSSQNRLIGNKTVASVGHNGILILFDCKYKVKKSGNGQVILQKKFSHTKKSFLDIYKDSGKLILYKSVNPETNCDFYTGTIHYEIGKKIVCPDWNPDKNIQCGNGLHLSPTPAMAKSYNDGKILECEVAVKDFVVYSGDITKVRCREVFVIEEVKDN